MRVWRKPERRRGSMPIPPIFAPFCRYWRLSDQQARQFWGALVHARYSRPSAWCHHLLLYEVTPWHTSWHLIDQVSTPATIMAVLEDLIHEGRLAPGVARHIETAILERTDRDGRWLATPIPPTTRERFYVHTN